MAAGIRYEVLVESDKRWAVAALCEEEDAAISQARVLLASGRYGAAKVMRERSGMLGLLSSKEVFHEKAAIRPAGRVEAQPADRMWLNPQRVDELYSPAFRRVVLQIVPGWLDEQGLTPTELLHSSVHMKAFRRNDRLVAAFLNQFVQAQIDVPGKPMDRIMQVDRLLTEAGRKAAAFERDRPIAILKPEDGAAAAAKAAAIADPEARRYALTAAVVAHLAEKRMWVEKADAAMTLFARAEDEALRGLVDEILAEAFTLPEMVRQFLGEHRDLGESLLALADVLQGRPALFGRGAWEKSPKLTGVLKRGQLPATQGALVARLQRVLAGRQPLCVGGPPAEAAVVAELRARLGDGKMNIIGGQATERALAARLTAKG